MNSEESARLDIVPARAQSQGKVERDGPRVGLLQLPVELIYKIHLFACNPALAVVNKHLYTALSHAPVSTKVRYLLACWWSKYASLTSDPGSHGEHLLAYCVRYPLCTPHVLIRLESHLLRKREPELKFFGNAFPNPRYRTSEDDDDSSGHQKRPRYLGHLRCSALPKRLFRNLERDVRGGRSSLDAAKDLPESISRHLDAFGSGMMPDKSALHLLLRLLLINESNPTSEDGFPLAKAVHAQLSGLVSLLIAAGAQPTAKDNFAVRVAIRAGWLEGIMLLVERSSERYWKHAGALERITEALLMEETDSAGPSAPDAPSSSAVEPHSPATSSEASGHSNSFKRRKLRDRVDCTSEMLREAVRAEAWPVVQYLMNEKNVTPDMRTIKLLEAKDHAGRRGR